MILPAITWSPIDKDLTPVPTSCTTATHSLPATAGSLGRTPYVPSIYSTYICEVYIVYVVYVIYLSINMIHFTSNYTTNHTHLFYIIHTIFKSEGLIGDARILTETSLEPSFSKGEATSYLYIHINK